MQLFFAAAAYRQLFARNLNFKMGEWLNPGKVYNERPVYTDEVTGGQQLFHIPDLDFGDDKFSIVKDLYIFSYTFHIIDLIQEYPDVFFADIKKHEFSFR